VDELTRLFLTARDGDRTALFHAVRASQADVWRLVVHLVGPNDADDVTQDTYVRAWKALPAFRGDSSARTWLLAIARRACADAVRRNVRCRRLIRRAEVCGVPVGTIRSRVARAREQLLEDLRDAETG
jgi:RNA polymerase sigma-70 factor, ECF subfamily